MADQDSSNPAKAELTRVPGLLDQYRQQRQAWLAQADELVRMRQEVRQAAEREAIEIVTAARRDVRRIIVEARRELLVLTAQLHAAVEATDAPGLEAAPFTALLADPEARSRVEDASHESDITRDLVHEARKGVRSVLDEARAEIEALSAEAPTMFGHASSMDAPPAAEGDDGPPAPVHELSLDASLSALDFQARDLPIPTLARILGSETGATTTPGVDSTAPQAFEPRAYDTPQLSELRTLLRDAVAPSGSQDAPSAPGGSRSVLTPDVEPRATSPYAFDTAPRPDFFADFAASDVAGQAGADTPEASESSRFTPPSRLFGADDSRSSAPSPARSARAFVGLFAATGALAIVGTIWWAFSRDSAPLSAATTPVVTEKAAPAAAPAPSPEPAVAAPAPGTLALIIETRRPSWLRAQIDGKDETGRIYQAGETRHIFGARTVSIRAGDAGAVFVGVDGGAARALGADGAAVTRRFSAAATATTVAAPPTALIPSASDAVAPASATIAPALATANSSAASRPSLTGATGTAPAVATARPTGAETAAARTPSPANQPSPAAPRSAAPAGSDPAAPLRDGVGGGRPDLVQAAQQWLDAYQRRDRDTMSAMGTESVTVSDERSVTERFPAWQGGVQRSLDEVALELTGDVAVFTARMTEHAESGGGQHVSRVSQFWQRRDGRWYVTNVRIIGEARLNQIIR